MDLRKLTIPKTSRPGKIFDSYSSLDVPLVRNATFNSLMLIGGTATQLLARAYNVTERRSRSINDLDFLTTAENKAGIARFREVLLQQGFSPIKMGDSDYMLNYENSEVGVEVDVLISYEPDVMSRAIKVNGILCISPCWQFVQKLQRIFGELSTKRSTDIQDINTLYDIVVARNEVPDLQDLISKEVPDVDEDELNSFLQE